MIITYYRLFVYTVAKFSYILNIYTRSIHAFVRVDVDDVYSLLVFIFFRIEKSPFVPQSTFMTYTASRVCCRAKEKLTYSQPLALLY